jgi:hypothetical protein
MAFKAGTTGNYGLIQIQNGRWNGPLIGPAFPGFLSTLHRLCALT